MKSQKQEIENRMKKEKELCQTAGCRVSDKEIKKQEIEKSRVIILDDNELSILSYAEEFPENWKRICEALEKEKKWKKKLKK